MRKLAIIIPAHNEGKVIENTILSAIEVVGKNNVFVVDDGSRDETSEYAKKFVKNVYKLEKNVGKASALNKAIEKFNITNNYEFIMPIDADTVIAKNFFDLIYPHFKNDSKKKIAAVIGKITGRNNKWITTYRLWEYEINQAVHKNAQSIMSCVTVCPGPSTIYRSKVFKKLKYSEDTLTEDMGYYSSFANS